ncbi:MAG: histidine phosphatase family protein [Burkholderiaceae bacterium]
MLLRRNFAVLALATLPALALPQTAGSPFAQRLRSGGCVVLWRHAQTEPGVGDPAGFTLASCSTQRNLSSAGRTQAQRAGAWFTAQALKPRSVLSSAWCRCKETADLAFGAHELWTPLNSTFAEGDQAGAARAAMARRLAMVPSGQFEVWVTHQVNITALTRAVLAMGEGLVVDSAGAIVARGEFG